MHTIFQQSCILYSLDITLALNSVNYTLSPTTPVFVESTIIQMLFLPAQKSSCIGVLTLTSRPALAGIPIIYHQTGILSIVGVHLRIKL